MLPCAAGRVAFPLVSVRRAAQRNAPGRDVPPVAELPARVPATILAQNQTRRA